MSDYELFRRLATYPFTSVTIRMLECALRTIRKRYPLALTQDAGEAVLEFPAQGAFEQESLPLRVTDEWTDYMQTVACSVNTTERGVSPSLWRLARGDHVDSGIVASYAQLLHSSCPSVRYADPVIFASEAMETASGLDSTSGAATIIPCHYDGAWFVAVSYADCVQLYGVQAEHSSKLDQQLQVLFPDLMARFAEPLATTRLEDTGILTLLGMRMLAEGGVPIQSADAEFLRSSRVRVFIELLTGTLDVKDSDVRSWLQEAQLEDSVFFDEAFGHETDSHSSISPAFPGDVAGGADFAFGSAPEPASSPLPAREASVSTTGQGSGIPADVSTGPSHHPSPSPHHPSSSPHLAGPAYEKVTSLRSGRIFGIGMYGMPPRMPEECRVILNLLSEAVAFYRRSRLSESSELAVIWSAIKNGSKSEFYRRYSGVLLHKNMAHLGSDHEVALLLKPDITAREIKDMRRQQSEFQIWYDVCQLRQNWGPGQYALLCVLPERPQLERMDREERRVQLEKIYQRLGDNGDVLSKYLSTVKDLCAALVQGNLPRDRLMIDDYHLKAYQDLSEPEFAAYASLEPRPVIEISRCELR
ncbi:hypothetical protein CGCFRS4_v015984 [Colletotrichum fructicola]|nr:hypothetical protein CGCFRS4_v015984 [Colletotrichum fructicola]